MATKKTNADYKADQYARMKAKGLVNRPLPMSAVQFAQLEDLMTWHNFTDWRELLLTMVRVCHAKGADGAWMVEIPPSGFTPTAAQLRKVGKQQHCETCDGDRFIKVHGAGGESWDEPCIECEGVE